MQSISLLSITADELRSIVADTVRDAIKTEVLPLIAPTPETDELLTREETARELHISKITLRKYEIRGILKPHRIGRRVLYSRRDIVAALAAGRPF